MSGIAGILRLDGGPVTPEDVARMTATLHHRGPDGGGQWAAGSIGLGHTLLHTTPESLAEAQPLTLDGTAWITADARLDDRAGLLRALEQAGRQSDPAAPDAALILSAYHAWGADCVHHLLGVFAFAIWDEHEQRLFCARDPLGIKPFVYHHGPRRFVFASEAKGVLAAPDVPRRLYEPRIADYLLGDLEGVDATCTFFEDVFRLPPARRLIITAAGTRREDTYWALDPAREVRYPTDADYVEAFRELFTEAVRCRLRVAGPAASMLSGGVDSSAVVAVAQALLAAEGRPELWTFSAISDAPDEVETRHIRAVLERVGTRSHTIRPAELEPLLPDINRLLDHTDDLFDHFVFIPQVMYALASRHGVRVLLDGVEGDLIASVSTGAVLAHLLRRGQWRTFWHEARAIKRHYYAGGGDSLARMVISAGRAAFVPDILRRLRRRWQADSLEAYIAGTGINPEFARQVDLLERRAALQRHSAGDYGDPRELQIASLNHPWLVAGVERYDRVAALYGIEPRHPLLDRRVVEFCLALPWEHKLRDGWSKVTLRRALVGSLPDAVCWREGRENLAPEFLGGYRTHSLLTAKPPLAEVIERAQPYMDTGVLRRDFADSRKSDTIEGEVRLWTAMTLTSWLHHRGRFGE